MITEVENNILLLKDESGFHDGYYFTDETGQIEITSRCRTFEEALVNLIDYAICLNPIENGEAVIKILNNRLLGKKLTYELDQPLTKMLVRFRYSVRLLKPDSFFTMDHRFDRINITTDYDEVITKVDMG